MNPLDQIRVVLVEPMIGGNIGAVCRAINNNGITDLAIVNPRSDTNWNEAKKLACNARPQLAIRKTFDTLEEAIGDCTLVAGTSARKGFYRDTAMTPSEFAPIALESAAHHKIALLFGREDKGLFNDELACCTHIINIPTSPLYNSLNLSHAVMICCYELFKVSDAFEAPIEKAEEADSQLRERMFDLWREMMIQTEFTHDQKLDHMMMGLRRIFSRGKLTVPDTKILMGLAKQALWVVGQWRKSSNQQKK
ncbi:MAG TPA: hypothetical protein DD620_05425 [Verrucomicrobia bacterium]|nr:hypothetical protein [Verrucomicrobiota bacterium]